MKRSDRELGMDRPITRRDFLNGVGAVAAGSLLPASALAEAATSLEGHAPATGAYPPRLTGMRGSHPGAFETAHLLAREGFKDWGPVTEVDAEVYDLIVVGGGISGLSAAYFYRKQKPDARILILDNHDDFGGHAKRNEFQIDGRTIIGYGGTQTIERPGGYSAVAQGLLRELGIDIPRLGAAYDQGFYRKHGLRGGLYFDRASYGVERVIPFELLNFSNYLPLAPSTMTAQDAVAQMPLSEPARRELLRALSIDENRILDVPAERQEEYLYSVSYRDFLAKYMGITHPEILSMLQGMATDLSVNFSIAPAMGEIGYVGLPGLNATALPSTVMFSEPYINHFPDGNASVARLLIRKMIPGVAPGSTMEDVVTARFDYDRLDRPESKVRMRLSSTAIRAENEGSPQTAERVGVTYVRGGKAYRVTGRSCVLACYNMIIPWLCPELPEPQRQALSLGVKVPILYTNVLLRDWKAWKKLGLAAVAAPGSYHAISILDFPVSIGGYEFAQSPEDPIVVHMERFATLTDAGATPAEQYRAGRLQLLATPFEVMEREIRTQLAGTLAGGGFDPARDIAAITVNRWSHGYAYWPNPFTDPQYEDGQYPHEIGRQRFGRIAIANSDAGGRPIMDAAIDQAYRAIGELTG
ncbi:MAG: NAD(P)-binding protein [Deltaproteobacteria bacterium]|jgi:spermidine dehydrogenase|nr:NAD(P)-binding protein [Deltaproteobacteria bacterium]